VQKSIPVEKEGKDTEGTEMILHPVVSADRGAAGTHLPRDLALAQTLGPKRRPKWLRKKRVNVNSRGLDQILSIAHPGPLLWTDVFL
jgi:hypothetical protein